MATDVKLPRLGQGMEAGTIVKWLKSEGDRVEKGEPLYELDTEKVTQEVEAEASGVLLRIRVGGGEPLYELDTEKVTQEVEAEASGVLLRIQVREGEVEVGRTIAVIGDEG